MATPRPSLLLTNLSCLAVLACAAACSGDGCGGGRRAEPVVETSGMEQEPRLVVIGVAGLDPDVLEDMMQGGKLPNLARLHASSLATGVPTDPLVAWADLVTGMPPRAHGVTGDVVRAGDGYGLVHLARGEPVRLDASGGESRLVAEPFWVALARGGVPVRVLRSPVGFPPHDMESGEVLSGAMTPTISARPGQYLVVEGGSPSSRRGALETGLRVPASRDGEGRWVVDLPGPLRGSETLTARIECETVAHSGKEEESLSISGSGDAVTVSTGQWSDWIPVRFEGGGRPVDAVTRVLPVEVDDDLLLVVEPPGADPFSPVFPLSEPRYWAGFLADTYGLYRTTGPAVDVDAFGEGAVGPAALLRQTWESWEQQERMVIGELGREGWRLFVTVFDQPGPALQVFSRVGDAGLPAHDARMRETWGDTPEKIYERIDGMVGEIRKGLSASDRIIVVCPRGLRPVAREFNLTTWLVREGYTVLEKGARPGKAQPQDAVDWSRTRAFAGGAGSVWLNLRGRDAMGIVEPGEEADAVVEEIRSALLTLSDGGDPVVSEVLLGDSVFEGPVRGRAPDLVVVLEPGWGIGPGGISGAVPARTFDDSESPWIPLADGGGPEDARGVLLTSLPAKGEPSVFDLAPTALGFFSVASPPSWSGHSFW